jgi:4-hydroxy-3-polyprenylbenzoate decarboxylase
MGNPDRGVLLRPDDLQNFISMLEQAGELSRVRCSVDPELEVAAIINAVCKGQGRGQALLFENVRGYRLPLAANLFGSPTRLAMALGVRDLSVLTKKFQADLAATGSQDVLLALKELVACAQHQAAYVDNAPCFARDVTESGLDALPALKSWPGDGGRYLTLAQVFTTHPETGTDNCGMYRVQLVGRDRALLRCHPGSGGAAHLAAWHARGEAMPVAITLGGPPIMTWLAGVSLPGCVKETAFAGYLSGRPMQMGRCRDFNLAVPATAEIVIEGRIFPGEELVEGPFGNHTGRYVPASPAPVIRVEKISMREGAVFPCTVVGPPPMENVQLAALTAQILLPLLQFDHPWVHDLYMPPESIFHGAAMIAVAPECGLSFEEISRALWASALLKNSKLLLLLDRDAPLRDSGAVYWRLLNSVVWPASPHIDGQKVALDARTPAGSRRVATGDELEQNVLRRWHEYGLDDKQ